MDGGDNQTTQSTTTQPWGPSQDLFKLALSDAKKFYKNGIGGDIYTGSTVTPWSKQTQNAMKGLMDFSTSSGLNNRARNIIGNGGFTNRQQDAYSGINDAANTAEQMTNNMMKTGGFNAQQQNALDSMRGAMNQSDTYAKNLMKTGGLSKPQLDALTNYRSTANSTFDYSPDFQAVLDASLGDARTGVNANAAAAGRYGSGTAQGVMTKTLGDLASTARLGEYRDWQNRKDAATGNMATLGQQGLGNQSGALQLRSGLGSTFFDAGQQGINNKNNAIQLQSGLNSTLFNAGQQGFQNMGSAYDLAMKPFETQMKVGSMNEDLASRVKQDELRMFNEMNNKPWEQLQKLIQAAGLGGNFTQSNTTQTTPGQNPFLTALGYGIGGLGLLGGFGTPSGTGGIGGGYGG